MRLIAGPCQHESYEQSLAIAKSMLFICNDLNIEYVFKASFDKANRTSLDGKRGLGLQETLDDFRNIKIMFPELKMLTDVHNEQQIWTIEREYADVIDVIQIPAFLCRQTDLITTACNSPFIVNIKKGQFLAPWDIAGILSKTKSAKEIWITERGTSFGYNTLVNDFTGVQYMLDNFPGVDVVFDATHSVQKPGGNGTSSGGNRAYVSTLARAAAAIGVTNFFMETHPDPDNAPSDGPNMVKLSDMKQILKGLKKINEC
jgi:2-dehydro-3-deoxyphosphooctonate aldolase (KDO 8-P synthase)